MQDIRVWGAEETFKLDVSIRESSKNRLRLKP